ncbi:metallophosphoesterase [Bacillus stercoris]|nr:metallophosphoesterase [Bacillus stercoris]
MSTNISPSKVFLISDTHFCHSNIIRYENRPFKDTDEMDEYMIESWNKVVSENDIVIHVGDVILAKAKKAKEILSRLNGRKILVLGNHDHFSKKKWKNLGFDPYERYFFKDYLITHIPFDEVPLRVAVENGFIKGNIHGHVHSQNSHLDQELYKCCCVELISYTPILFEEFIGLKVSN